MNHTVMAPMGSRLSLVSSCQNSGQQRHSMRRFLAKEAVQDVGRTDFGKRLLNLDELQGFWKHMCSHHGVTGVWLLVHKVSATS